MNGQSLLGTSHQEAVRALQNLSTTVTLLVCDGYNGRDITTEKSAAGISVQVCVSVSVTQSLIDSVMKLGGCWCSDMKAILPVKKLARLEIMNPKRFAVHRMG